ncbi:MAG: formylglycine-generating enzyme family protein [Treponema sp.]|jgi:formylglycine-generating enzyme required for sulfatase activity|nr:formylglycine-generating enzyme family protein [Treponema sp.]
MQERLLKRNTLFFVAVLLVFIITACDMNSPILPKTRPRLAVVDRTSAPITITITWDEARLPNPRHKMGYEILISEDRTQHERNKRLEGKWEPQFRLPSPYSTDEPSITIPIEPKKQWYVTIVAINYDKLYYAVYPLFEVRIEADLPMLPVLPVMPVRYDQNMVFVEGGVFNFHGKQVEVDSFYISKYELTKDVVYHCEVWAVKNGIQDMYRYISVRDSMGGYGNVPFQATWYATLYICNLLSMQGGYRPVYYLDPDLTNALLYRDIQKVPVYIDMGIDREAVVEYSLLDFYIDNTADGFRLPTEVEWEYAARGGNKSKGYIYSGSNIAEEVAWFGRLISARIDIYSVGTKRGNELGLHDMSGNSPEWCIDYWSNAPLIDNALRNEIYFYEANRWTGFRVTKGAVYDRYDSLDEESIAEYLRPNARVMTDLYYIRWHDSQSERLDVPAITFSREIDNFGIRLVQKRQE